MYYNYDDDSLYKLDSLGKKYYKINNWKDEVFFSQLKKVCHSLISNNHIQGPKIPLFTQHNRIKKGSDKNLSEKNIFRADPFYDKAGPWYDWANVDWGEPYKIVPAKLLIFLDLSNNFISTFKIGDCYVTEKGYYALAYSFLNAPVIGGHATSTLVLWATLIPSNGEIIDTKDLSEIPFEEHKLCIFPVDSIESTCIAVPFYPHQSLIAASQWLILLSRGLWYQKFLDKLNAFKTKKKNYEN